MPSLRYVLCDVFTDQPLCGNALAVFTRATGLASEKKQAIAREMALSEIAFVEPPERGGHAKLTIYTPRREVPMACHPLLGAAVVLGGPLQAEVVNLETQAGVFPVRLEREGARIVFGWLQLPLPQVEAFGQAAELATALGLSQAASSLNLYNNGVRHVLFELPSLLAVAQLKPDLSQLMDLEADVFGVFAGSGSDFKLRVFSPSAGIQEDAATGSSAGLLAYHLSQNDRLQGDTLLTIQQGEEVQRPATVFAKVLGTPATAEALLVGGAAVVVGRGELVI